MKKIVDDNRLIYKCCYLYYMDGLGQKEICDQLGDFTGNSIQTAQGGEGKRCGKNRIG